jgi:hypothetical protein
MQEFKKAFEGPAIKYLTVISLSDQKAENFAKSW